MRGGPNGVGVVLKSIEEGVVTAPVTKELSGLKQHLFCPQIHEFAGTGCPSSSP